MLVPGHVLLIHHRALPSLRRSEVSSRVNNTPASVQAPLPTSADEALAMLGSAMGYLAAADPAAMPADPRPPTPGNGG